jgi:hypothetical protein
MEKREKLGFWVKCWIWCCCDVSLEEFLRRSLESLVFVGYCSNRAMP